jgi:histone deacetylase 6
MDLADTLMHDGDGEIVSSTEFIAAPSSFENGSLSNGATGATSTALKVKGDKEDIVPLKDGPKPPKFKHLPYATAQTGLIYDVRMRFHVEAIPAEDDLHPEDPRRIHAIFEAFVQAGLAWRESTSGPLTDYYMGRIDARMVTREEVLLVHTKAHWDWVQSLSSRTADDLEHYLQHPGQIRLDSVYLSPSTPYCAALSAGGAIEACRATLLGKVKNVFAIIRPPGHHAEREDAKGFCFFDNVSIATRESSEAHAEKF